MDFWAGAASSVQGVEAAEDGHSMWRRGRPSSGKGQEVLAGGGGNCRGRGQESQGSLYRGLGEQQTSCSSFCSSFGLGRLISALRKQSSPLQLPDKALRCRRCRCSAPYQHQGTVQQSGAGGEDRQLPAQNVNPVSLPPARAMPCCPPAGTEGGQTFCRVRKGEEGRRTHKVTRALPCRQLFSVKGPIPFCDPVNRSLLGPDFSSGAEVRACQSPESRSILAADLTSLLT